jgi:predicted DNA-binding transcriptional regulator AlpA
MSISEIALKYDVSRSSVHTYRRGGTFPRPAPVEGMEKTKLRFRSDEVAAWFKANPKSQGKRTHLPAKQQGETVESTTESRQTAEPASLFRAIRARSGDHLLKRFEDIEEAVEEQLPNLFALPLGERGALIGELYVEACRHEEARKATDG